MLLCCPSSRKKCLRLQRIDDFLAPPGLVEWARRKAVRVLSASRRGLPDAPRLRAKESAARKGRGAAPGDRRVPQRCLAARGEARRDWSEGLLLASEEAVCFESTERPFWSVGPIRWRDIERCGLRRGLVVLQPTGTGACVLVGAAAEAIVERANAWPRQFHNAGDISPVSCLSISDCVFDEDIIARGEAVLHQHLRAADLPQAALGEAPSPASSFLSCTGSARSPAAEAEPQVQEFFDWCGDVDAELPTVFPPSLEGTKVFEARLDAGLSIDDVEHVMRMDQDWPIRRACWATASAVACSPWAASSRLPGSRLRRCTFRMPLPKVPGCPETTATTVLIRQGRFDDTVVLLHKVYTHDVPFGKNFVVWDLLLFTGGDDGRVAFKKYTRVEWVTPLPFLARCMVGVIESSTLKGSAEVAERLAEHLGALAPTLARDVCLKEPSATFPSADEGGTMTPAESTLDTRRCPEDLSMPTSFDVDWADDRDSTPSRCSPVHAAAPPQSAARDAFAP